MDAMWHLIQFTPDMRRKEPRNIGVAVAVEGQWAIKLYAVDSRGQINGRALRRFGLTKDGYSGWVDYYTDMILEGSWEQVIRSQQRRPTEFRLITGGYVPASGNAHEVAENLYADLVAREEQHGEPWAKLLRQRVENALAMAEIHPQPDVAVPAVWGDSQDADEQETVKFDYQYTNGQLHLMDRLQLHQASVDNSKIIAREFHARVTAARTAGASRSFIAFYSGEALNEMNTDSMLTPIFKVAGIVDVDHADHAADELLRLIYSR
ncbi:hypothetical protein [Nocardia sp. NPDC050793]|uniref:hypothetical protein n=1 Tax=Nocardia sp. NPDC050793 TaxID=3155159 RepID=UPI0033C9075F